LLGESALCFSTGALPDTGLDRSTPVTQAGTERALHNILRGFTKLQVTVS